MGSSTDLKIEIGGGVTPTGRGFLNVDRLACADVALNLEGVKLPFEDDSVDEVYSSHCLEHIVAVVPLLTEILRVCKVGAAFELRVPHWLHPFTMCPDHKHVISDRQIQLWCDAPDWHWPQSRKVFALAEPIHYQIDVGVFEFEKMFPNVSREFLAKWMPGCSHEIRAKLKVVERELKP